jgi:hypothetical protein
MRSASAIIVLALIASSAAARPAHAPAGVGTVHPISSATPLTEGECTKLGGTVESKDFSPIASVCNSGKVCRTTDQNNKQHLVCISKS